jgi:hypothetical protein
MRVAGLGAADIALDEEGALSEPAPNGLDCSVVEAGSFVSQTIVAPNHCLAVISWHAQLRAEVVAEHRIYSSVERRESLYLIVHLRAALVGAAVELVLRYMCSAHLVADEHPEVSAVSQVVVLYIAVVTRDC